jgi:Xaa-Pro aminopeptidase
MTNLERLRAKMAEKGVDALFVSDIHNVYWLAGFTGSSGFCLVTKDQALFLTDSRYAIQSELEVSDLDVRWYGSPVTFKEFFTQALKDLGVSKLHFETSVKYSQWQAWTKDFPDVEWTASPSVLTPLRMVKTPGEVEKIREACRLAESCLSHIQRMIQPGVTEYDILLDLEFFLKRNGAIPSFDPIVASGPNSAKPHATPSERKLESGEFLTIDMGAKLDGYCSDITRTFVVGQASDRHKEVYNQVLKAEVESINAIKPGKTCGEIDAFSREILDEIGLAKYFGHGLGHGLGIEVHDYGRLGRGSKDVIEPGQVWTVEPGVYIEGFGGVRVEDDVVVTEDGVEVLTTFPKELTCLP